MEMIKNSLQPLLKVKVDIVTDFDYGLKDVFEKRPAIVFIQEQIAGVTGESVARHIQMLLGAGAPSFIFMHEDSSKVKPIKGLYEHLIDLSQTESKLIEDIQSTLKLLLGSQWEKIYIPTPVAPSPTIDSSAELPGENRTDADQLVDDLLSDLKKSSSAVTGLGNSTQDFSSYAATPEETMVIVSSEQDQLAEMLVESAQRPVDAAAGDLQIQTPLKSEISAPTEPTVSRRQKTQSLQPKTAKPARQPKVSSATDPCPAAIPITYETVLSSPADDSPSTSPSGPEPSSVNSAHSPLPVSPSEFRIKADSTSHESSPQELLLAFEQNYLQQVRARKRNVAIACVVLIFIGCGWYLARSKPWRFNSPGPSIPSVAATKSVVQPVVSVQGQTSTARSASAITLPSFIPQTGFDSSYGAKNPGWERYQGSTVEFRLFRTDARIKALQVVALPGNVVSDSLLKTVLNELTGTSEVSVVSTENKPGYSVVRATVKKSSSELLIYRNKAGVRAFVVALD
jgi:hypothetical protein